MQTRLFTDSYLRGITVYEERVSILGVDPQRFNTDLAYSDGVMAEIRSTMPVFRSRAKFGCGILKRGSFLAVEDSESPE